MTHLPLFPHTNQLLAALSVAERGAFMAACEPVDLEFNEVLVQPGERIRHIYFPIDGVISMMRAGWKSRWWGARVCWVFR